MVRATLLRSEKSILRMILALKNILFTLVVPGTVGVYLPLILARGRNAATDFFLGLAIIFFVIGGSIYSWCVFDFASFGRGTPAPIDAPKKLVRRGLYRYSRNPMYVGVLTVIYGWGDSLSEHRGCSVRNRRCVLLL